MWSPDILITFFNIILRYSFLRKMEGEKDIKFPYEK
jgi:hypothetical protein